MSSSYHSMGDHTSVSHENPDEFSSRTVTRGVPHTTSYSHSYSFGSSNDVSNANENEGSSSVSHQFSRNLPYDSSNNVSHSFSRTISRTFSGESSHHAGRNSSNEVSHGFSRSLPNESSYETWNNASHNANNEISPDISQGFSHSLSEDISRMLARSPSSEESDDAADHNVNTQQQQLSHKPSRDLYRQDSNDHFWCAVCNDSHERWDERSRISQRSQAPSPAGDDLGDASHGGSHDVPRDLSHKISHRLLQKPSKDLSRQSSNDHFHCSLCGDAHDGWDSRSRISQRSHDPSPVRAATGETSDEHTKGVSTGVYEDGHGPGRDTSHNIPVISVSDSNSHDTSRKSHDSSSDRYGGDRHVSYSNIPRNTARTVPSSQMHIVHNASEDDGEHHSSHKVPSGQTNIAQRTSEDGDRHGSRTEHPDPQKSSSSQTNVTHRISEGDDGHHHSSNKDKVPSGQTNVTHRTSEDGDGYSGLTGPHRNSHTPNQTTVMNRISEGGDGHDGHTSRGDTSRSTTTQVPSTQTYRTPVDSHERDTPRTTVSSVPYQTEATRRKSQDGDRHGSHTSYRDTYSSAISNDPSTQICNIPGHHHHHDHNTSFSATSDFPPTQTRVARNTFGDDGYDSRTSYNSTSRNSNRNVPSGHTHTSYEEDKPRGPTGNVVTNISEGYRGRDDPSGHYKTRNMTIGEIPRDTSGPSHVASFEKSSRPPNVSHNISGGDHGHDGSTGHRHSSYITTTTGRTPHDVSDGSHVTEREGPSRETNITRSVSDGDHGHDGPAGRRRITTSNVPRSQTNIYEEDYRHDGPPSHRHNIPMVAASTTPRGDSDHTHTRTREISNDDPRPGGSTNQKTSRFIPGQTPRVTFEDNHSTARDDPPRQTNFTHIYEDGPGPGRGGLSDHETSSTTTREGPRDSSHHSHNTVRNDVPGRTNTVQDYEDGPGRGGSTKTTNVTAGMNPRDTFHHTHNTVRSGDPGRTNVTYNYEDGSGRTNVTRDYEDISGRTNVTRDYEDGSGRTNVIRDYEDGSGRTNITRGYVDGPEPTNITRGYEDGSGRTNISHDYEDGSGRTNVTRDYEDVPGRNNPKNHKSSNIIIGNVPRPSSDHNRNKRDGMSSLTNLTQSVYEDNRGSDGPTSHTHHTTSRDIPGPVSRDTPRIPNDTGRRGSNTQTTYTTQNIPPPGSGHHSTDRNDPPNPVPGTVPSGHNHHSGRDGPPPQKTYTTQNIPPPGNHHHSTERDDPSGQPPGIKSSEHRHHDGRDGPPGQKTYVIPPPGTFHHGTGRDEPPSQTPGTNSSEHHHHDGSDGPPARETYTTQNIPPPESHQQSTERSGPPNPVPGVTSSGHRHPDGPSGLSSHPHIPHSSVPADAVPGRSSHDSTGHNDPARGQPPQGPLPSGHPPQGPAFQPPIPSGSHPHGTHTLHNKERSVSGRSDTDASHTGEPPSEHRGMPKPITRHGWRRWLHISAWFVHIPAIITTIILLWLSSRERFWYGVAGPTRPDLSPKGVEVLLLVAIKIYEILVILSLSAMSISMLRRRLIGGGVRLGFLTGGYRVGDFRYLFSRPFWRQGFFSLSFWETMLTAFFLFATLFIIILLPAAGAIILPSLEWFPLSHRRAFGDLSTPLLYQTQASQVWPTTFADSSPWNNTPSCTEVEGIYNSACPAGGFTDVWNWAGGYGSVGMPDELTFSQPSTDIRRQLVITELTGSDLTETELAGLGGQGPPVLSTTPSHHFNINLSILKSYINNGTGGDVNEDLPYRLNTRRVDPQNPDDQQSSSPIYQPFVQSKCRVSSKAQILAGNASMEYPAASFNCFGDEACLQAQRTSRDRALNATLWATPDCDGQLITTGLFVYQNGTPMLEISGQLPDPAGDHGKDRLFACTLVATWVTANISTDSSECDALVSSLNRREAMVDTYQRAAFGGVGEGYVMKFETSWMQYLAPVSFASSVMVNGSKALRYYSPYESFVRHFTDAEAASLNNTATGTRRDSTAGNNNSTSTSNSTSAELYLAKVFGAYLTDAISRTGSQSSPQVRSDSAGQLQVASLRPQDKNKTPTLVNHAVQTLTDSTIEKTVAVRDDAVSDSSASDSVGFDFNIERYGWGTGRPRAELRFGQAVLYIYLAVLILYLLTAVIFGLLLGLTGRWASMQALSVIPWWDLQGLMMLALRSPTLRDGDLMDAGAGVSSSRFWKKRVRAMADAHSNVQLVLNDGTTREELDKTGKERYY